MPAKMPVHGDPCTCCERCWEKCDINYGGACAGCGACPHCGECSSALGNIYEEDEEHNYYCCDEAYVDDHPEKASAVLGDRPSE